MENNKKRKFSIKIFFILYILLLIWIIVFKFRLNISSIKSIRSINLLPFKTNTLVNGIKETIINFLLFIPFGMYLKYFFKNHTFFNIVIIILTSFIFEVLQYVLHIGVSDITDIIMNTFGGLIGIILINIMFSLTKRLNLFNKLIDYILIFIPIIMLLILLIL